MGVQMGIVPDCMRPPMRGQVCLAHFKQMRRTVALAISAPANVSDATENKRACCCNGDDARTPFLRQRGRTNTRVPKSQCWDAQFEAAGLLACGIFGNSHSFLHCSRARGGKKTDQNGNEADLSSSTMHAAPFAFVFAMHA